MVEHTPSSEEVLRQRITRFLDCRPLWRRPICQMFHKLREHGWSCVLFGGTIRDLMIGGPSIEPRDIDLVIDAVSIEDLMNVFRRELKRKTRFGGLHLEAKGWLFDIWPLGQTWAFRSGAFAPSTFAELPRTTFLNVEAVAAELFPAKGLRREIHSCGFFEAYESRTVDINFEENPYPSLCVVRALITTAKLGFAMGSRLARYVVDHGSRVSVEELLQVQRSHYGMVRCRAEEVNHWIQHIRSELNRGRHASIYLPIARQRQLTLWDWVPTLSEALPGHDKRRLGCQRRKHSGYRSSTELNQGKLWA